MSVAVNPLRTGRDQSTFESFTPTWKGDSADPAIGDGTIAGYKKYVGDELIVIVQIKCGSTTTFGTGNWYFTIPDGKQIKLDPGTTQPRMAVGYSYTDDIGTSLKSGLVLVDADDPTKIRLMLAGSQANFYSATLPMTWANTDWLHFYARIPIAS